ncbi:hypothetical protein NDU88_010649 [Pleurodeles waltl]|uniref:Uncharacterized protein n=1 Tax=Pleurodeles waltl TaxID=8319 RepID=A0AAV7R160_PLEWA|nr:hypothetical protein NDU88_010649 [Pleurodeles waltl]
METEAAGEQRSRAQGSARHVLPCVPGCSSLSAVRMGGAGSCRAGLGGLASRQAVVGARLCTRQAVHVGRGTGLVGVVRRGVGATRGGRPTFVANCCVAALARRADDEGTHTGHEAGMLWSL